MELKLIKDDVENKSMAEEPSACHLFKSLLMFNFTRFDISGLQHGLQLLYF